MPSKYLYRTHKTLSALINFIKRYLQIIVNLSTGNVSLMAALASAGASRLRTPQLLSACAADLLVCAASAPLAATRAARIHHLPCHVTYYIEVSRSNDN